MSSSPMPEEVTELAFICDCEERARYVCVGEPFYKEIEGKRFCVFHYPSEEKSADFKVALQKKIDNADFGFRGVWFPDEPSFSGFKFGTQVNFTNATFKAAADFSNTTFKAGAYFNNATFAADANFSSATFTAVAYFSGVAFHAAANFNFAEFAKGADFISTIFNKEAHFSGVVFSAAPESGPAADFTALSLSVSFRSANFGAKADFFSAIFDGADFGSTTFAEEAYFSGAVFKAEASFSAAVAYFTSATFHAVSYFNNTTFSGETFFVSAHFVKGAEFVSATFRLIADFSAAIFNAKADFSSASFSEMANFTFATFSDYVVFAGNDNQLVFSGKASLNLQFARIEKPESVSFHTLALRPYWFVNTDPRKFYFTNVDWNWTDVDEEVKALTNKRISQPHRLLTIACRNLAVNAEENHRYEEASRLRYMAMDARRSEHWHGLAFWRLSWWYWLASGFGERISRALIVLIGIWLFFTVLYTQVGFARWEPRRSNEQEAITEQRDEVGASLKLPRALTYSLAVMTLQKPEPRPATIPAQSFIILETILGPLQAALLALAIRRKFMR